MLKEKMNNAKEFVKEHKNTIIEIVVIGVVGIGAIENIKMDIETDKLVFKNRDEIEALKKIVNEIKESK